MAAAPEKSEISAPYPNPSNGVMRLGMGRLYDWAVGLLGASGTPAEARGILGAYSSFGGNIDGAINQRRVTVASHATNADIWSALGNSINWTGTAVTTAFPNAPQAGATRRLHCAAGSKFINSATLQIIGNADFEATAGAIVEVEAITLSTFRLIPIKADGTPLVAVGGGRLIGFQVIAATGSYLKATNNPSFVIVEAQGGGGGGGGTATTGSASAGGGSGGYAMKRILASALGATETVTIGNGGAAGVVGGTGGAGGATSFGSHLTCAGGGGGLGSTSVGSLPGGAGGVATGGDLNCTGNPGGRSNTNPSVSNGYNASGEGGASRFGGAGYSVANGSDQRGGNGAANSGSGGGGSATNAAGQLGSTGGSGVVIVWEYA